ncbi:hypothetical protein QTI66_31650 [Variovorax sp. J22R133]|uniref:hypothetical protein n=1 Tax=Variovorax brevis TaxID=3053503 RepID=UPI0025791B71|nr:hypothetical protein [Variovorax sp. J22R133]MDM0116695.1 hypothetical protein [Variovorax sp. J22R133]
MKSELPPRFETRRAPELERELFERARAWIPQWGRDDDPRDFGRALLKVAARFASEVAERLDRAGEKVRLGFLDWLAVPIEAARPARLPVVFKLTDSATEAKPATASTRLQVEAAGTSVILETEKDLLVLPRGLQVLVGVDGAADAFFLPPPGLSDLTPLEPLPTQWQLKSFASTGATKLQLEPEQGLEAEMLIEVGNEQYRITQVDKGIVTIDPPLDADRAVQTVATKVTAFMPFDAARNRQRHVLYIGHTELFNIEAAATIEILGARNLTGVTWHYWGKKYPADTIDWQELSPAETALQSKADGLVLAKPRGALEMTEVVQGKPSRWIRASVATVLPDQPPLLVDAFEIRVNCRHGVPQPADVDLSASASSRSSATAEAMANTTPLVLDSVFYPFGKEPRQFDAFYLGSKEAFSKKGGDITLTFGMAEATFAALSLVPDSFGGKVLAGVAEDGALYLLEMNATSGALQKFRDRAAIRPPLSEGTANVDVSAGRQLNRQPLGRLPVWHDAVDPGGFLVGASSGGIVWVWRERSDKDASKWELFGEVPALPAQGDAAISDLVYFADASTLVALRGGQLSARKSGDAAPWTAIATTTPDPKTGDPVPVVLEAVVPVLTGGALTTSTAAGMVGISRGRKLYRVAADGNCIDLERTNVDAHMRPVAVLNSAGFFVAFVRKSNRNPVLFHLPGKVQKQVKLEEADAEVIGFNAFVTGGELHFVASVHLPSGGYVVSWTPPSGGNEIEAFRDDIPAGAGEPKGAPTVANAHVLVPATRGHVLSAPFDLSQRWTLKGDVGEALFAPGPEALQTGEFLAREMAAADAFSLTDIAEAGTTTDGQTFYLQGKPFAVAAKGPLHGYRTVSAHPLKVLSSDAIQLDAADMTTRVGSVILTSDGVAHRVTKISGTNAMTLEPPPKPSPPAGATYFEDTPITARVSPYMRLDPANPPWKTELLPQASLLFPGFGPVQTAKAFRLLGGAPELLELSHAWTSLAKPSGTVAFKLDATVGTWRSALDDASVNPELSWEYWNGTGWWKLIVTQDETANLKVSGPLKFKVPLDLAPTDWSGRTNYWIRARLVGGDYGREKVSVTIGPKDPTTKIRHQTIERSTENIHAPAVVELGISYEVCTNVMPDFVLTADSGSLRDQSDANRTPGANVEAFVPLAQLLGRLSGAPSASAAPDKCEPDCECAGAAAAVTSAQPASASAGASTGAAGRAIYLGLDATLLGEPINVLLLVEERPHDQFAPMTVEALIADRFAPVTTNDATRALGESGILTLAFAIAPTLRELFGQELSWLRLTPAASTAPGTWAPKILGAYLNGVWASAAETMTRELIGSSQGEPDLTLFLARPPLLRNTLELRVKEPLGEEERTALNQERPNYVLSAVENLPGDWVLWDRVVDPADESPMARVYALYEATGEIRFGDGKHGKIPPVGSDSIMAFAYRRTTPGEPGSDNVPGNAIAQRTSLNLVSPIEGVEAVFAADQAAGGAPAESIDRVLQFGVASLRHRDRALTAHDFSDIARESSPDIAQARCFPRKGFVRLVVVMRGANPMPTAAQVRELRRLLLSQAPPTLAAPEVLRIGGARLRRLRVDLRLRVASLDDAGAVASDAKKKVIALFDAATGGVDGSGWHLGENPNEIDIAVVLADVALLEGIAAVSLREITDDDEQAWPPSIARADLPRLEKDGVRIEFETVEVIA